jgi:integrase/predicted nucleic acid-binding Zn ribbon protein
MSISDARHLLLEDKITQLTSGLPNRYRKAMCEISSNNVLTISEYIQSMKIEINLSNHYRRDLILLLCTFSKYNYDKPYNDLKRRDILAFLNSFAKPEESDPLHKWIGTYNIYREHLQRFFKWLYHPNVGPAKRPKPSVVENIPRLKRKEQSIYRPSDLWTTGDDLLFLKYCPSKRMKCFHAMSRDTSCRPHELLKLRIKDIVFKSASGNRQYAEVLVNGKTGSRHIPLIDSLPYIKDYINHEHPFPSNPNAILLCGIGKSLGRTIQVAALHRVYGIYKTELFPKLLQGSNATDEDKQKIKELLKKPWNPYIRRHSALTEKSSFLKEHILRQHAGWSPRSQMHLKYLHYFGNESSDNILEAYGIITKDKVQSDALRSKHCPNCNEPNEPDSKFCAKCRMVLTYDAYNETLEKQQEKDSEIQILREKQEQDMMLMREEMENKFQQILARIDVATLK